MTDSPIRMAGGRRTVKITAVRLLAMAMPTAIGLYLLLRVVLATSYGADAVASLLTAYLHQPVTVAGLKLTGKTVTVEGIVIHPPPGFKGREMLAARKISLAPDLSGIISGATKISNLELTGLRINLEKKSAGAWNFSSLATTLRARKTKKSGDIHIAHLAIHDSSIIINGTSIGSLDLSLYDFSTRGTTESRLNLSAKDRDGNPLQLVAQGKIGADPALNIRMTAPALSLAPLSALLNRSAPLDLGKAAANLSVVADLRNSVLSARGEAGLSRIGLTLGNEERLLSGKLGVFLRYDARTDEARLERLSLSVGDIVTVWGKGAVSRVGKDRRFTLDLFPGEVRFRDILAFLPGEKRRGMELDGILTSRGFHFEGNSPAGITSGAGHFHVRSATLSGKGHLLLRDGSADIALTGTREGWSVEGRLTAVRGKGSPLITSLNAPFSVRFTPRGRLEIARSPGIAAVVMGADLKGECTYHPASSRPGTIALTMAGFPLTELNRYLRKSSAATISSGRGNAAIRIAGRSPKDFSGRVTVTAHELSGKTTGKSVSIRKLALDSELKRSDRGYSTLGSVQLSGGSLDGKPCAASLSFATQNGNLAIHQGKLSLDRSRVHIANAALRLSSLSETTAGGIPLTGTLDGIEASSGNLAMTGLSGKIDCTYFPGRPEQRLLGNADIVIRAIGLPNRPVASLAGRFTFRGNRVDADIRGTSLKGNLDAKIHAEPFSPSRASSFKLRLANQHLNQLSGLFHAKSAPGFSSGTADATLQGSFAMKDGIKGTLTAHGHDISLAGAGGKILVAGAGVALESEFTGFDVSIRKAVFTQNQGLTLTAQGRINRFATPERTGSISFSLPKTPINNLLEAFVNALPRKLQEATCEGSCSLTGEVELNGKDMQVQGSGALEAASMDVPSQKLQISDANGRVPFSIGIPWKGAARKPSPLSYSRENYPKLRENLEGAAKTGNRVTIGKIRFGGIEAGPLTFMITAEKHTMEVTYFDASLYGGKLYGKGFFRYNNASEYGSDLLLHDLSLTRFCDSFPSVKGYITGKVDGIISIATVKAKDGGVAGYADLWARSGGGEKMLVSKEFLQKLAGKNLRGFLFHNDRPYDNGEISAYLKNGYLTFERLDISHTNILGMRDLSVSVVPVQNRISFTHLLDSIREAAARGKGGNGEQAPVQTDLKWLE